MLCLITGGTSNGKSALAENLILTLKGSDSLYYIATMRVWNKEGEEKVADHRRRRAGMGFETIEQYTDINTLNIGGSTLLECLSNLLANEMYDKNKSGREAAEKILSDIDCLRKKTNNLVIVTNETFSDTASYSESCLEYIDTLAYLNTAIASKADRIIEAVAGIPVKIK